MTSVPRGYFAGNVPSVSHDVQLAKTSGKPHELISLSKSNNHGVQKLVAENSAAPHTALAILATSSNKNVRKAVALHPNVSGPLLSALMKDREPKVRESAEVILHWRLEKTARSSVTEILIEVAYHEYCPAGVLTSLSNHYDSRVRLAVAKHKATPPHILLVLTQDFATEVSLAAWTNPSLP